MKHGINRKKLSKKSSHRISLLRNLSKSLINFGMVKTTLYKAKVLRSFIEKIITKSRLNSLHNKRLVIAKLGSNYQEIYKLTTVIAKKYLKRNGGYIKITKISYRKGDCSSMAILKLV